ncbi:MAG: phospholipase D family protein [Candidatus ainarchaeum sp.]|nr:phospholipase D family protein [Candidatus ainarchaeum sp.]
MNFFTKKELIFFILIIICSVTIIFFIEKNYEIYFDKSKIDFVDFECDSKINIYFCPQDFCSTRMISEINSAQDTILVAIYSFTHSEIADALINAKQRGVKIIIVMDYLQSTSKHSLHLLLEKNDIPVFIKKDLGSMHNKFMVIDGIKVFTGSFNYSLNADTKNDENLLLILDDCIAKKFVLKFNSLSNTN